MKKNQALNYAEGRASFRSGEIRIIAVKADHRTAHQPLDGYWLRGQRNGRPGDSCKADSRDFDGFAVEHVDTRVIENLANKLRLP